MATLLTLPGALINDNHRHHHNDHHARHDHHDHHDHHHPHAHDNHWRKAGMGLVWGGTMLLLGLFGGGLPFGVALVTQVLTSIMTLFLGIKVYQTAWRDLAAKRLSSASLYTISTLSILAVSTLALFIPGLPAMLEAAPLVLGFWHLGEAIEHSLIERIAQRLDVRECLPKQVNLLNEKGARRAVNDLTVGDEIVLAAGDVLPVDGILLKATQLYTTRIDGSPRLQHFAVGAHVLSGMQLPKTSSATLRVSVPYVRSYLSLLALHIDKATATKAPVELMTDKILQYFIPGLLVIATLSGILVSQFISPAMAFHCVISVLVSACPCVLSLITPMAVKIGMQKGATCGIQFKHGLALQACADIDSVVFDLNGTLTEGKLSVAKCTLKEPKIAGYIAALEAHSTHPVAAVICQYLQAGGESKPTKCNVVNVNTSHHFGISAIINGKRCIIGNREMLRCHHINIIPPFDNPANGNVYVAYQQEVVGQIAIEDPIRNDALATLLQLKRQGKQVFMCTGADEITARRYALRLGICEQNIYANSLGVASHHGERSKQQFIEQLQANGHKVAMVGDAANDAVAIASADIGVAVHSRIGDNALHDSAGMVIQQGRLGPIALAFAIAARTKRSIVQNLLISLGYNSVITLLSAGLFIGIGLTVNPILGVALMVLESTVVLGNIWHLKSQVVLPDAINGQAAPRIKQSSHCSMQQLNRPAGICLLNRQAKDSGVTLSATADSPEPKTSFAIKKALAAAAVCPAPSR